MTAAVLSQILLVAYHQITTWFDFYPFNGARNHSKKEKAAEACTNAILMGLPPVGFAFQVRSLMSFGVVYYFILFAIELIIWWVPYLTVPTGRWRVLYNRVLSIATSNFEKGDTLDHWTAVFHRLHRGTITLLPARGDRPVPNLEHMILHAGTLLTAVLTLMAYGSASR